MALREPRKAWTVEEAAEYDALRKFKLYKYL